MQTTNFNWYPVDPYGKIWRFAYYFDIEDINNLNKIEVAEVSNCDNKIWRWEILNNNLFHSLLFGYSKDRDEAMGTITRMIN